MVNLRTVLAADLGGTKCRFALVAEDFSVHRVRKVPTSEDRSRFLERMDQAVREVLEEVPAGLDRPKAMGVGTAGVIPLDGRSILRAPNLPLDGFGLSDHAEELHGLPTVLINDGRASAWGEYLGGKARGKDPLLCLFFGTGIGVGLMVGGKPFGGADNAAGEIGHTVYVPDGRPCPCGGRGHFEAYCGGRAMELRAAEELGDPPGGGSWDVGKILEHDSAAARGILADATQAAGTLVANACTLLDPSAVVLGGGVLAGWPELRRNIEEYARSEATEVVARQVTFVDSVGGSDAVLWGAAAATDALW